MRTGIINEVHKIMKETKDSYFLTGDLGFHVLEEIEKDFPKRFINVGIAEQNMMGIASGLALSGKKVFVYSIIPFLIMRCFEQIRNDINYHNLDVTLLGVGSGLSYGILSGTHFALEDIAVLRTLTNIAIFSPADEMEGILGMRASRNYHRPLYVRIGLRSEPTIYEKPFPFVFGKGRLIKKGKDIVVFITGNIMKNALLSIKRFEEETKMTASIIDLHTINPLDEKIILEESKNKKAIFTVEEHGLIGGLGDAVLNVLSKNFIRTKFVKIGVKTQDLKVVGSKDYLRKKLGLSVKGILKQIKKVFS